MSDDEAEDRAGKARVKWPRVLREDPSAEEDHHDDKASPSEEELRMEMDDDDGDEVAIPGDWTVHGKPVADGPAAFQVVYHGEPFYFTAPAEKKKGRPKLDKTAGKKKTATTTAAKPSRPGRFYKNLLPLAKSIDEQRIQSETVLALSRCVDVMADSIAEVPPSCCPR
jgi:hypothetical protein